MFFQTGFNARVVKKLLCGASMGALATVIAGPVGAQPAQPDVEEVTSAATGTASGASPRAVRT